MRSRWWSMFFSALLMLAERDGFALADRTVGIVGVGNVGGRLQKNVWKRWELKTLLCDPPRADRGDEGDFRSPDELVQQADVLTFHTPLFKDGPYKTLHLADEALISRLQPGAILINACRGPVVDNAALLKRLQAGQQLSVVLDVWEPEPDLNTELLARVDIGTSHIAGYTLEGKARGTTRVFEAYSAFIGHPQQVALDTLLPAPEFGRITLHGPLDQATLKRLVHLVYDVRRDDAPLRKVAGIAGEFDKLRKKIIRNAANGLPCTYSAAMKKQRRCCVSSVLMPYIILFVNIFLMPLSDNPAGSLFSGVHHHV